MQSEVRRRKLRFAVGMSVTGFGIGAWYGSAIGIAAVGTAISGWLPVGVLGVLSIWLVYYFGKRAMVALPRYLKRVAIRAVNSLKAELSELRRSHDRQRAFAWIVIGLLVVLFSVGK